MMKLNLMAFATAVLLATCGTARAQAPVPGQPYQVPAGYEAYQAGTLISYGGFNYVIQGNGTMLLADQPAGTAADSGTDSGTDAGADSGPVDGQAYQVPGGYEGYAAGTLISYGGANYVIQGDGTMVLASGGDDGSSDGSADSSQVYQVPAGYESYTAGTLISYGGASYVLQGNGTMVLSVQIGGGGATGGSFGYNSNYVAPGGGGGTYLTRNPGVNNGRSPGRGITQPRGPGVRPGYAGGTLVRGGPQAGPGRISPSRYNMVGGRSNFSRPQMGGGGRMNVGGGRGGFGGGGMRAGGGGGGGMRMGGGGGRRR